MDPVQTYVAVDSLRQGLLHAGILAIADDPAPEQLAPFYHIFTAFLPRWESAFHQDFSTLFAKAITCELLHSSFTPVDQQRQGACVCWFDLLLQQGHYLAQLKAQILVFQRRVLLYGSTARGCSLSLPAALLNASIDQPVDFYKLVQVT